MTAVRGRKARTAPDLEAAEFRELLDQAAAIATGHWERQPEMRAYTRPPEELVAAWRAAPLPLSGEPLDRVLDRIARDVVPYPLGVGQRAGGDSSTPLPIPWASPPS